MTAGVAGIVLVGYMLRSMVPRRRGAHGGIVLAYAAAPALHDLVQVADAAVERWVELRVRMSMRLAMLAEGADGEKSAKGAAAL